MLPVQGSGGRDNQGRGGLISEFRKSSGVRKAPELFEFFRLIEVGDLFRRSGVEIPLVLKGVDFHDGCHDDVRKRPW